MEVIQTTPDSGQGSEALWHNKKGQNIYGNIDRNKKKSSKNRSHMVSSRSNEAEMLNDLSRDGTIGRGQTPEQGPSITVQ